MIAKEFGHNLRIVPKEQLAAEIGSAIYHGARVDETSAGVNPARYVAGLAEAAVRAGASVFERTRVTEIARSSENGAPGWKVTTPRGKVAAREVFVATSGYTGRRRPRCRRKSFRSGRTSSSLKCCPSRSGGGAQPAQPDDL